MEPNAIEIMLLIMAAIIVLFYSIKLVLVYVSAEHRQPEYSMPVYTSGRAAAKDRRRYGYIR